MLKILQCIVYSIHLTQMSSCGPSYCWPSKTSGAAYGGLPHHVARGSPGWKKFPNPKSTEGKEPLWWGGVKQKISCLNCKSHSNICWKHGAALRWGLVLLENVKEVMHLVSFYSLVAAVTEVERKKMSRTTWGLQVLHNALCDPHICTLRKWVIEWGNLPWRWTWDLCAVIGCLQSK